MDVDLKKRWDLIPNIVASVKGYAKHEAQTLENVIKARNGRYQDLSDDEKLAANAELSRSLAGINVVAEQYPDLKANENFLNLNSQLQKTEEDISSSAPVTKIERQIIRRLLLPRVRHTGRRQSKVCADAYIHRSSDILPMQEH